jgi:bifunctional enzyme CysN/CysC
MTEEDRSTSNRAVLAEGAVGRERMAIVVVGHVDHGKSTVVGRLLADTGSLPEGKLERVRAVCRRTGRPFEMAFLLDALKDEQSQGITIDVARVFFKTARRDYVIIDAPGHAELLRNMVTGAARAQAALLVIDAAEGVRETSRRHGTMLSLLGVEQVVVVVNKMDLVSFRADVFRAIEAEYRAFLRKLGVEPVCFIPASGRDGDFVATRSERAPWYVGPTVLDAIDALEAPSLQGGPLRLPVQDVYRFPGDDRRIVAGTVARGAIAAGDELVFYPSGKRTRVRTIEETGRAAAASIGAGRPVGVTLAEQVYVGRGEVAARASEPPPSVATRLRANVLWLGDAPLAAGKEYVLRLATARVRARVERIASVVDASTLESASSDLVGRGDVAECIFELAQPVACEVGGAPELGRFVIVDEYEIRGGGTVREVLPEERARGEAAGRAPGTVVWLTGLSGAGKTTIAKALAARLEASGRAVEVLDGDAIRAVMPTGFSREERDAHVRRVAFFASRLAHHGVTVVAALISPFEASRAQARAMCGRFVEVYVATPLAVCEARDAKGLYAKARAGTLKGMTGIDDPYEPPSAAEVVVDSSSRSVEEIASEVLAALARKENERR